jgi:hypothetical protein
MFVSCECCVLSDTSLCDALIICSEESQGLRVCLSVIEKPRHQGGPGPLGAVVPLEEKTEMYKF